MRKSISRPEKSLFSLLAGAGILFLFVGCDTDTVYRKIDFSKTVAASRETDSRKNTEELRVAVAAMISPKETFIYYKQLLDYIADRLGYRVQLIQRKTYEEINLLFPKRQIDLAFICTGPYAASKEIYGFEAIATPIVRGLPFYQSYLIVNRKSPYQTLEDLKDRVFAFTDPDSNTGAMVPRFWLTEIGETPESFFSDVKYTYSHDNSILAVAKKLVDGAAVDGHKWEYYNTRSPYFTSATKVIRKSRPVGGPPLVTSIYLPEALKNRIRETVLAMHETDEGRRILDALLIDRFQSPREEWYRPVQEMYRAISTRPRGGHGSQDS